MADLGGRPPPGQVSPNPWMGAAYTGGGTPAPIPVGHPATGQPSMPLPTQAPLPSVAPPMMNVNQGMTPSGQSTLPQAPPMSNVNQGMTPSGYPVQQLASALRTRRFIQ